MISAFCRGIVGRASGTRTEPCGPPKAKGLPPTAGQSEAGQYAQTGGSPDSLIMKFANEWMSLQRL
jgi:hypothetical protein